MKPLEIQPTESSPMVILNPETGVFEFSGESRPEDVRAFYLPIIQWMEDYGKELINSQSNKKINVRFNFEYFNSSSARFIMDIINKTNEIELSSQNRIMFEILWCYEAMDQDMLEAGEEFQNIIKKPFKFILVK